MLACTLAVKPSRLTISSIWPRYPRAAHYRPVQCEAIRAKLGLRLNHQPVKLNLESSALEFPSGAGGLPTLRLTCTFQTVIVPLTENVLVEFNNKVYAERLGWREIVVTSEGAR
jgi:nickel/cobalt transporter (NicO) family protein